MTLMQMFGFEAADLEATQHGRLSVRQQSNLISHLMQETVHPSGITRMVKRLTDDNIFL